MTPPTLTQADRPFSDADTQKSFHFKSWLDARKEADRRKADPAWAGFVSRVERSFYGRGYTVRSVPIDRVIERVIDEGRFGAGVSYEDL